MKVWQIATGEIGRDYRDVFFNYDIMILGPSHLGDAALNSYAEIPKVRSFARNPSPGDRVLMRLAGEVIAVGEIPPGDENQYSFNEVFNCVYGWDLCHCRRVIWSKKKSILSEFAEAFSKITPMAAFTQVHRQDIVKKARKIHSSVFDRPLEELPNIDASIYSEGELGIELFRAGISNKNIDDITEALQQAERLRSWYESDPDVCGRKPTEKEVISHMILPLFLGLGWSHQQVAVEWNRIDMAFFKETPTTAKNCVMVLEAKGLGKPLDKALEQPKRYVRKKGLYGVKYILATDGANLFVYERKKRGWSLDPIAYLSIRSLQKEYILPKSTNAIDTLVRLQPSAV